MFWILLLIFYFVLVTGEVFSLNLSLAPGLSIKNASFYALLGILAMHHAVTRKSPFEGYGSIHLPFLLFLGWAAMTLMATVVLTDPPASSTMERIISYKSRIVDQYLIFAVFLLGVSSAETGLRLAKGMLLVVAFSSVVALLDGFDVVNVIQAPLRDDGRIGGPLGNPNGYAAFLVFFVPQLLAAALISRGVMKLGLVLGGLVSLVLLVMTASRAGLLGLAVGGILGSMAFSRQARKRAIGAILATYALIIPVSLVLLDPAFVDMLLSRVMFQESATLNQASSGRIGIWGEALYLLTERPYTWLTGYGWDTFGDINRIGHGLSMHSIYFGYLFDLGLIGLGFYLITILMIVVIARRGSDAHVDWATPVLGGFVAGLIGFQTCLLFGESFKSQFLVWPYIGLAIHLAGCAVSERSDATARDGDSVAVGLNPPARRIQS